eukprot:scaffold29832_cov112-Isochrysis_galbana.AAC.3
MAPPSCLSRPTALPNWLSVSSCSACWTCGSRGKEVGGWGGAPAACPALRRGAARRMGLSSKHGRHRRTCCSDACEPNTSAFPSSMSFCLLLGLLPTPLPPGLPPEPPGGLAASSPMRSSAGAPLALAMPADTLPRPTSSLAAATVLRVFRINFRRSARVDSDMWKRSGLRVADSIAESMSARSISIDSRSASRRFAVGSSCRARHWRSVASASVTAAATSALTSSNGSLGIAALHSHLTLRGGGHSLSDPRNSLKDELCVNRIHPESSFCSPTKQPTPQAEGGRWGMASPE